jgi:opacity protein-like surface antigen
MLTSKDQNRLLLLTDTFEQEVGMKQLLVAATLALMLAPAALAAAPVQDTSPWDRTRVIPASAETCAFPIQVHSTGTIHTWTFSDGRQMTILQDFKIEWTNLETGLVARTPLGGPAIVYPDGTLVINGNNGRFIAQGEGLAYADLGRTITTVEGVIFSAGQHSETLFPDVCAALD